MDCKSDGNLPDLYYNTCLEGETHWTRLIANIKKNKTKIEIRDIQFVISHRNWLH